MGTRGAIGFRLGGRDKITYNHFDSYPNALGEEMVGFARKVARNIPKWKALVEQWRPVTDDEKPTPQIIKKLEKLGTVSLGVGNQSLMDWYCLLRNAQGNPEMALKAGVFKDAAAFLHDSLFCEYAYIINFDDETIEFYKGFNEYPDAPGRYAKGKGNPTSEYFGVALMGSEPLADIPKDWKRLFKS